MKTKHIRILIILVMGLCVFGCDRENNNSLSLSGEMVSHSACKNELKSASMDSNTPDSVSCIEYFFDEANSKLSVLHINAGFNCCPESLYCDIALKEDTILIREFESAAQCNCNCLFDLNIEITGVDAKKYQVRFVEPYAGDQEKIVFGIDLGIDREGSFCVSRKQYPWGLSSL